MLAKRGGHVDPRHVGIEDLRSFGGVIRQEDTLDAHAGLDGRTGDDPVQITVLYLDDIFVSTQGTSFGSAAPGGGADLKIDGPRKAFRGDGLQLQADTCLGLELVLSPASPSGHVMAVAVIFNEISPAAVLEHIDPYALGLEVHGLALLSSPQKHAGRKKKDGQVFLHIRYSFDSSFMLLFFCFGDRKDIFLQAQERFHIPWKESYSSFLCSQKKGIFRIHLWEYPGWHTF